MDLRTGIILEMIAGSLRQMASQIDTLTGADSRLAPTRTRVGNSGGFLEGKPSLMKPYRRKGPYRKSIGKASPKFVKEVTNFKKPWTSEQDNVLRSLVKQDKSFAEIGRDMGRSKSSVASRIVLLRRHGQL